MQKNGFSLLCNVISGSHSHPKNAETERESFAFLCFFFFFFYRMPDSCTVFGCNKKTD